MPLTPADVHNVAFSKPPIGKRGYNEDEVDAFLDLVEVELSRLIEENNELRQQVEQLDAQLESARADLDDARVNAPHPPRVDEPRRLTPVPPPSAMEQTSLEKKIDELRTFEREYRTRLKTFLESSLRELGDRGSAAPSASDGGRGGGQQGYAFGPRAEAG